MREIDKKIDNSIKRKKQMKTTTLAMALLVAAIMVISPIPAMNINDSTQMNENEGGYAPLNDPPATITSSNTAPDVSPTADILDKEFQYSGSSRSELVWDNGMWYYGLYRSEVGTGVTSQLADDFLFSVDQAVHEVRWIGGYWGGTTTTGWEIIFYKDDGSGAKPGADFAGPFTYTWDEVEKIPAGSYYEMWVDIPATIFDGGQKYWISIYALGDNVAPYAGWGMHWYSILLHQAMWRWPEYTPPYPDWVPTEVLLVYYPAADLCFQLAVLPAHDVYVDEIITPTSASEFCPCTPVEVTVKNAGLNDETDVPVSVEIRNYIWQDSFENYGVWYNYQYYNNYWYQSWSEMTYPWVVMPRTGNYMAELDSGMTGSGYAYYRTMNTIDVSDNCHTMMSFYMWHDQYGSDDSIEVWVNGQKVGGPYYRLCCPDCPQGWMEHVIDISQFTGSIYIEFRGYCDYVSTAYDLQIDDVSVYDQEYYEEVLVDVDAGQTVNVEFPEWCLCHWQDEDYANDNYDVEVIACTNLVTDEIPGNDCVTEDITVYVPFIHDIAAISIDKPVADRVPAQTFEMCGTIQNVGQYQECCFSVYMTVQKEMGIGPGYQALFENFNSAFPPAGWTSTIYPGKYIGWAWNYYPNYADGSYTYDTCAEANSDYWYYNGGNVGGDLITPIVNLGTALTATLEFDLYAYCYGETFTVDVFDGANWVNLDTFEYIYTSGHFTYDITDYVNSNFKVRFGYDDNGYWAYYVQIDNFEINVGSTIVYGPAEYTDQYCVDEIDVCEEMQICFKDWTPAQPWPDCDSVSYLICLEARLCDPADDNIYNNIVCEAITVDFWHDVGVKEFTSPAEAKGDIIWDNGPADDFSNALSSQLALNYPFNSQMADDFLLTDDAEIGAVNFWGGFWNGYPVNPMDVNVIFYEDDGTGTQPTGSGLPDPTPTALAVYHFDGVTGTLEGTFAWKYTVALDPPFEASGGQKYWLVCQADLGFPPQWGFATTTYPGQLAQAVQGFPLLGYPYWTDVYYGDVAFTLEGKGAPTADVYIQCGEQDLCAIFENLGTFDETGCIINWELYEYMTAWPDPTYVTGGSTTIDLGVGEEKEVCFATYEFEDAGIYELYVEIVAPVDCYDDNNEDSIFIGVDCCPPETEYTQTPATPNGQNNWYTSTVTVKIDALDPPCPDPCEAGVISGVKEIHYKLNGVETTKADDTVTFTITTDGNNLVEFWAIDNVGNEEKPHHTFTVALDKTKPTVELVFEAYQDDSGNWKVDFTALASDATSGVNRVEFKKDTTLLTTITVGPYKYTYSWTEGDGTKTFYAYVYDNAGNSNSDSGVVGPLSKNLNIQGQGLAKTLPKVLVQSK